MTAAPLARPGRPVGFLLVLAAALLIAFDEVDRIAGQFPGAQGHSLSILGQTGPLALLQRDGWTGWEGMASTPAPAIAEYLVLDVVFIAVYTWGIHRAIAAWLPPAVAVGTIGRDARIARSARHQARAGLRALVVLDLTEDALLGWVALELGHELPEGLAVALACASTAKWLAVAAIVGAFLRPAANRTRLADALRHARGALYAQRLSVVVVVVLAVLTLLPPWHELLAQVPDLERSWGDREPGTREWLSWRHGVAALIALLCLAGASLLLGRKRAETYWDTHVMGRGGAGTRRLYGPAPADQARRRWPGLRYLLWALPGTAVLVVAAVLAATGNGDALEPVTLGIFLGINAGLIVTSAVAEIVLCRRPRPLGRRVPFGRTKDRQFVARITSAGDILAVLVLIVGLLGFARSLGSLVLARVALGDFEGDLASPLIWSLVAVVAAAGLTLVPRALRLRHLESAGQTPARSAEDTPALRERLRGAPAALRREFDPRATEETPTGLGMAIAALVGLLAVGTIVVILTRPFTIGGALGGVAVTVALLGAIVTLLGLVIIVLRRRRPLAIFELLGLRSDPVLVLVVVVPLIAVLGSPVGALHSVERRYGDAVEVNDRPAYERPDLEAAFRNWVARTEGCDSYRNGTAMRPLVLVAAEGGGIRAATWTAAVLAEISEDGACAANSVFLSSGVSGGSVGLAVATTLDRSAVGSDVVVEGWDPGYPDRLRSEIYDLGRGDTLPVAIAGLLGSDQIAAFTGIRLPTLDDPDGWHDRAAMIEQAWRESDRRLELPWDETPAVPTGLVVFNSTDILTGCRVAVSQLALGAGASGSTTDSTGDRPRCDQGSNEPALTIDLVDFFGKCSLATDWATSAMLSARFPVVTPGGVVDHGEICRRDGDAQDAHDRLHLVDGGYAENSGLGLIADLAPALARIVTQHNATTDGALVVPYVVYLQNSPGAYLAARVDETVPEIAVPAAGLATKAMQVTPNAWIQRAMASLGALCPPGAPACEARADDLRLGSASGAGSSPRVVIAAANEEPSVTIPLGWGLSKATYDQLVRAAATAARASCTPPAWSEYSCLGDLLSRLSPATPTPLPAN